MDDDEEEPQQQGVNNNNNNNEGFVNPAIEEDDDDDDDDEDHDEDEDDEEDEDDDDDDDEQEDQEENNADGVFDGGVAEPLEKGKERRRATEADITLFVVCKENMSQYPDHAILKEGVSVQIGLDKNTRLSAVFDRFVQFCNERSSADSNNNKQQQHAVVNVSDLEFVHNQLLQGNDTPEQAALMKSDRITVRPDCSAERASEAVLKRLQREADKNYFSQLRKLVPSSSSSSAARVRDATADVILDCQGPVHDDSGQRVQRVLSTTVRCNSALVSKRCPWLGLLIGKARRERQQAAAARRSIVTVVDTVASEDSNDNNAPILEDDPPEDDERLEDVVDKERPAAVGKESEDEDDIGVLSLNNNRNNNVVAPAALHGAAQIENDEDEPTAGTMMDIAVPSAPEADESSLGSNSNRAAAEEEEEESSVLRVTLPDYSTDAVKILLEYCYTNRVVPLGYEAFLRACKSKGVIPPYPMTSRRWPNHGRPAVSFRAALAGLRLAEDASMPRLSLMCETAAAQLVGASNVVEALSMCETQKKATANPLPRLRKAAMDVLLRSRVVTGMASFRTALETDRGASLVPTLLTGTAEAVQGIDDKKKTRTGSSSHNSSSHQHSGSKRDWKTMAYDYFGEMDYADACAREQERHERRLERLQNDPRVSSAEEEAQKLYEPPRRKQPPDSHYSNESSAKRRSLKRLSQHALPHHHHHHHKSGGANARGAVAAARVAAARRGRHYRNSR